MAMMNVGRVPAKNYNTLQAFTDNLVQVVQRRKAEKKEKANESNTKAVGVYNAMNSASVKDQEAFLKTGRGQEWATHMLKNELAAGSRNEKGYVSIVFSAPNKAQTAPKYKDPSTMTAEEHDEYNKNRLRELHPELSEKVFTSTPAKSGTTGVLGQIAQGPQKPTSGGYDSAGNRSSRGLFGLNANTKIQSGRITPSTPGTPAVPWQTKFKKATTEPKGLTPNNLLVDLRKQESAAATMDQRIRKYYQDEEQFERRLNSTRSGRYYALDKSEKIKLPNNYREVIKDKQYMQDRLNPGEDDRPPKPIDKQMIITDFVSSTRLRLNTVFGTVKPYPVLDRDGNIVFKEVNGHMTNNPELILDKNGEPIPNTDMMHHSAYKIGGELVNAIIQGLELDDQIPDIENPNSPWYWSSNMENPKKRTKALLEELNILWVAADPEAPVGYPNVFSEESLAVIKQRMEDMHYIQEEDLTLAPGDIVEGVWVKEIGGTR